MRTSEMIQSKYVRKEELKGAPLILTIAACTCEEFGSGGRDGRKDQKWVLWFSDHGKGLSLNNTKIRLLEASYGDDSDYWVGKRVRLSFDPSVIMAGQVVGGIKLECSNQTARAAAPAAPPGAPPPPVWDGSKWVMQQPIAAAPQFVTPPPDTQAPQPPPTWRQQTDTAHPPVGVVPEFDDDIPF